MKYKVEIYKNYPELSAQDKSVVDEYLEIRKNEFKKSYGYEYYKKLDEWDIQENTTYFILKDDKGKIVAGASLVAPFKDLLPIEDELKIDFSKYSKKIDDFNYLELDGIVVLPEYRNQGLTKILNKERFNYAKENNIEILFGNILFQNQVPHVKLMEDKLALIIDENFSNTHGGHSKVGIYFIDEIKCKDLYIELEGQENIKKPEELLERFSVFSKLSHLISALKIKTNQKQNEV